MACTPYGSCCYARRSGYDTCICCVGATMTVRRSLSNWPAAQAVPWSALSRRGCSRWWGRPCTRAWWLMSNRCAAGAIGDADLATTPHAPLVLALDGVQDPHNLGACLRTADACGALAVVVPRDRAVGLNATARKVAAGAAETTPVATVTNLARTLTLLKQAGLWIVGADVSAERRANDVDLSGPLCLVMGAEGSGLRELTRRHCDWLVRLPSLGAVESLNVSVACGMLLYEAVRQRQAP